MSPSLVVCKLSVRPPSPGAPSGSLTGGPNALEPGQGSHLSSLAERSRLAGGLRKFQAERVGHCRLYRVASSVALVERVNEDGAPSLVLRGLQSCASVHSCPLCAPIIMAKRGPEVVQAVGQMGHGRTYLATFTLRHAERMPLRLLRKLLASAYGELKAGRTGARLKHRVGHRGDLRSAEQTHGTNGWHPHLHALWFSGRSMSDTEMRLHLSARWRVCVVRAFQRMRTLVRDIRMAVRLDEDLSEFEARCARVFGGWYCATGDIAEAAERVADDLRKLGGVENVLPDAVHGVDVRKTDGKKDTAYYLAKLGLEVTSVTKEGRNGSDTPWAIARRAAAGDEEAQRLWREHAQAMKGARQLTWSRGLRARVGLGPERTDADLIADDERPKPWDRMLGYIDRNTWDAEVRARGHATLVELAQAYASGEPVLEWVHAPIREGWRAHRELPPLLPRHATQRRLALSDGESELRTDASATAPPAWTRDWSAMWRAARTKAETRADGYMSSEARDLALEEVRHHLLFDMGLL